MQKLLLFVSFAAVACAGAILIADLAHNAMPRAADMPAVAADMASVATATTVATEDAIDLALAMTFPASDPPAWTAAQLPLTPTTTVVADDIQPRSRK